MALFAKPAPNHCQGITGLTKPASIPAAAKRAQSGAGEGRKMAILLPALAFLAVGSIAFYALQKLTTPQHSVTASAAVPAPDLKPQSAITSSGALDIEQQVAAPSLLNNDISPPLDEIDTFTQPDPNVYVEMEPSDESVVVENVAQVAAQDQPIEQIVEDQAFIAASIEPEVIKVVPVENCFEDVRSLAAKSTIFYGSGSADLDTTALRTLRTFAQNVIACSEVTVHVTGHSDTVGSEQGNMAMSWKRADIAVASLDQLGIDSSQFEPVGFGARTPLSQGDSGDDELNRRVEFHVLRKHSDNP